MKNTIKLLGIIAITAIIGFSMFACGGGNGDVEDTRDPVIFMGMAGSVQYSLKIEDPGIRSILTPAADDLYTLTKGTGAGAVTSTGTVTSGGPPLKLQPSESGAGEITISITNNGSITSMEGTVTWSDESSDNLDILDFPPFPGKIAIVTNVASQNPEEFRSAEQLIAKYGADKIIHKTWPEDFMGGQGEMINLLGELAADTEIKALIINQAVQGTNAAVDEFKKTRSNVFIAYCKPADSYSGVASRSNLIMDMNELAMGPAMAAQAKKQGADVFVHYSFPRHMGQGMLSDRRDLIAEECGKLGITFVDVIDADADPVEVGISNSQKFISDDVPLKVAEHGANTAFFSTNCAHQPALIKAVVDAGAIYPQPCCPSPLHGFPEALEIDIDDMDLGEVIEETRLILTQENMIGRVSTWPVPSSMLFTVVGAEYAIRWINGDVSSTGINNAVLADCMSAYINDVTGEEIDVSMTTHPAYSQFKQILMDYLDY